MQVPLNKIDEYVYEIPQSFRRDMRVPARLFASEKLLTEIGKDRSLEQLVNTATIPGIEKTAMAMPDIHEGYGFPIGGVVATRTEDGVISPGGIGYDINCGVRLLRSDADADAVRPKIEALATQIQRDVPSGLGKGGDVKLGPERMDMVLRSGVDWMIEQGYATEQDRIFCEAEGRLPEADAGLVSDHAKRRGRDQLGTLGSGNHFLEVQRVEEILLPDVAQTFGLREGQIVILVHCGSRGLGHQVATDYIRAFLPKLAQWGIELPDRELVGAPFRSRQGQGYFQAMNAAANFAFANRQMITHQIRGAWRRVFGDALGNLELVYDIAHNMGKVETYTRTDADGTRTNADGDGLLYEGLTYRLRGLFFHIRKEIGLGHKETVYQKALETLLRKEGIAFERERAIDIRLDGQPLGVYRPDFIVEGSILLEMKSLAFLGQREEKQLWQYLKGSPYRLALLVNFGGEDVEVRRVVYDTAREKRLRESASSPRESALLVHRKGATRAFGPGRPEIPAPYRDVGQPVFIPGSMGTASWVLVGTAHAAEISFSTTCHGAGRRMSRHAAKRSVAYEDLLRRMREKGIVVRGGSRGGLLEEAAEAYKDVDEVVRVVDAVGIAKRVARLVPLAVVKG